MQEKVEGPQRLFLRKKRREMAERRSGSAAGLGKGWKYSGVLSFLDPFVNPREMSSNMGQGVAEDRTAEDRGEDSRDGGDGYLEEQGATGVQMRERRKLDPQAVASRMTSDKGLHKSHIKLV